MNALSHQPSNRNSVTSVSLKSGVALLSMALMMSVAMASNAFGVNPRNVTPLKCGSVFSIPRGVMSNFVIGANNHLTKSIVRLMKSNAAAVVCGQDIPSLPCQLLLTHEPAVSV